MVSEYHTPLKGIRILRQMANSRSGAENDQDKSGTSCHAKEQGRSQRLLVSCQKDSEAILNRLLLAKDRTI